MTKHTINLFTPLEELHAALARGSNFVPAEALGGLGRMDALVIDMRLPLGQAWAAGWHLARHMGQLQAFEESLQRCPYYCPWAVPAITTCPRGGLAGFIRLCDEPVSAEDAPDESFYHRFFRQARQHATDERCLIKPQYLQEQTDDVPDYKLRELGLADAMMKVLITQVASGRTPLPQEDDTHHVHVVKALIDAFSDFKSPFGGEQGIEPLLTEAWNKMKPEDRARIEWLEPLMTSRRGGKKTAKKSAKGTT